MHDFDAFEDDASGTVFRDVVMLALAGFVVLVLLLPHLNPPGAKTADDMTPPGNVIVEVRWPDEIDADVDLWVQAPGDRPVGYSNKGGAMFNLLRDDLGKRTDVELAVASRGARPRSIRSRPLPAVSSRSHSPVEIVRSVTSFTHEPDSKAHHRHR